jgi:O-antigen ligase/polysaccharide polymerase Wzy-like membrane protein
VPAAALVATWIAWATDGGGYFAIDRYPGALLAAALLLTIAIARPPGAFVRSPALLPLGLFAAWTAWNAVSVAWTGAPDTGWESTNELLAIVVMGAVMAATPWGSRSVLALLALWAAGVAVIAVVDLVSFGVASDPGQWLLYSRFTGPVGYANGTAALGGMAFWPLLAVAAAPRVPAVLRVLALPVAVAVLAWALLPQSRGTMIGGVVALPLFVALSSHRVRVLTRLVVAGGAIALAIPALFDVYTTAANGKPLDTVVETAVLRSGLAVAVAFAASIVLVAAEGRVRPGVVGQRRIRRAGLAGLALAIVLAGGVAAASQARIGDELSERWDTFRSDASVENTQTGARIGQVTADQRYDYWTVALKAFREQPVAGIGAGGFENRYSAHKKYAKHSRYAHDLWLRALSETGVIGLALLVGFLVAMLVALVRARLRGPVELHPAIAASAALSVAFFVQCGLDWLEEVPTLLAAAVCLPLAVLRARAPADAPPLRFGAPGAAALAVVAIVAMVPPYLAVRYIAEGDDLRATDPQAALTAYAHAADVNPLALDPIRKRGFVALSLHDAALARRSFRQVLDMREDWASHFELGLLDAQAGRKRAAAAQIRRAAELNRNDPLVDDSLAAVERGERLDPLAVNAQAANQPALQPPP